MTVTADIVATYRAPRRVMRRHLNRSRREERALAYLIAGCGLVFVAQMPRVARQAELDPELAFGQIASGELYVWLFIMPLAFYGLAAIGHLVAHAMGGQGGWSGARLALFWTLLATTPLWLGRGLVAGFAGEGLVLDLFGLAAIIAFVAIWVATLREAERGAMTEAA